MRRRLKVTVTRIRRARPTGKTVVVRVVSDPEGSSVGVEPEVVAAEIGDPESDLKACINALLEMAETERNR